MALPFALTVQQALTGVAAMFAGAYLLLVATGVRGRLRGIKPLPALVLAVAHPDLAPVLACWAAGDALLLDKDRFFLHGLGAFLLGHLWYIALVGHTHGVSAPGLAVGVALAAGMVGTLWGGLRPKLRAPVAAYAVALAGVLGVALAAGAGAGATLFLVSDAVLAWNRFRSPLPRGDLVVMVTYFAALFLFAAA